jgi:lysophospholipase L1-like esterase
MLRPRFLTKFLLCATAIAALAFVTVTGQTPASPGHRIAVFGSSVANGTGDDLGKEGYTGRLRELLAPRGWEVLNQSRGGDNTKTMATRFAPEGTPDPKVRYLLPVNPNYVLLGLSLGNEGILGPDSSLAPDAAKVKKDAIFAQFESGMRGFVDASRRHHIVPVITLCYTRNDFTAVEYEYTRRMNLLINTWDVPSVNFLGAVDDGTGKWANGFWHDALHPNAAGHAEMLRTFVPSLFDAIEQGKPGPGARINSGPSVTGFAHLASGDAPIIFSPDESMHPFAFGVTVRVQADGTFASVKGSTLTLASQMKREDRPGGRGALEFEASTLTLAGAFTETVGVKRGVLELTASNGSVVSSPVKADGQWHRVIVSHYTARGETLFFVDGTLAGTVSERLEPKTFALGGSMPADFKNLLIYRSALNADEAAALEKGTLLQASLEIYSPLDDAKNPKNGMLANRAQSLTAATFGSGKASTSRSH